MPCYAHNAPSWHDFVIDWARATRILDTRFRNEVATLAFDSGLARVERTADIAAAVTETMFEPHYMSPL